MCPDGTLAASDRTKLFSKATLKPETYPYIETHTYAPVAQLDRVLPSEGRGHRFESCRVRQANYDDPGDLLPVLAREISSAMGARVFRASTQATSLRWKEPDTHITDAKNGTAYGPGQSH